MKKQHVIILVIIGIIAALGVGAALFRNQTPDQNATPSAQQTPQATLPEDTEQVGVVANGMYWVDTEQSAIEWEGRKTLIADYKDTGSIRVQSGSFTVANDTITSGSITFDMTSIKAEKTLGPGGVGNLEKHLKSADFFDVENHPTATFTVTGTERTAEGALTVHGDLTVKGITNPISIPVQFGSANGHVVAAGSVEVERTQYNIRYGSDRFFDNLANNVIDDFFTLRFTLIANAQ